MVDKNDVTGQRPGRSKERRRYVAAAAVSLGVHVVFLLALASARTSPHVPQSPAFVPVEVTLYRPLPPPPPPAPPPPEPTVEPAADAGAAPAEAPAAARPVPARAATRPRPPRDIPTPPVDTLPAPRVAAPAPFPTLGEAQLAGALMAGTGSGAGGPGGVGAGTGGSGSGAGGPCDMVRRIEEALRTDPEVRAAIAQASRVEGSGRALLVWNGDWIQNPGQAGKGLAGVRQAIGLEVAFAPAACRSQSVRGFAVIKLGDGPGAPRVALGTAAWRWSDLTGARR